MKKRVALQERQTLELLQVRQPAMNVVHLEQILLLRAYVLSLQDVQDVIELQVVQAVRDALHSWQVLPLIA